LLSGGAVDLIAEFVLSFRPWNYRSFHSERNAALSRSTYGFIEAAISRRTSLPLRLLAHSTAMTELNTQPAALVLGTTLRFISLATCTVGILAFECRRRTFISASVQGIGERAF
jgi:hypothetical protein